MLSYSIYYTVPLLTYSCLSYYNYYYQSNISLIVFGGIFWAGYQKPFFLRLIEHKAGQKGVKTTCKIERKGGLLRRLLWSLEVLRPGSHGPDRPRTALLTNGTTAWVVSAPVCAPVSGVNPRHFGLLGLAADDTNSRLNNRLSDFHAGRAPTLNQ